MEELAQEVEDWAPLRKTATSALLGEEAEPRPSCEETVQNTGGQPGFV